MEAYVPTWHIFERVPIAHICTRSADTTILLALWLRNGMFGRSHNGTPINPTQGYSNAGVA